MKSVLQKLMLIYVGRCSYQYIDITVSMPKQFSAALQQFKDSTLDSQDKKTMKSPQEISYLPISHAKAMELDQYFQQKDRKGFKEQRTADQVKKSIIESPQYNNLFNNIIQDVPFPGYDPNGEKKVLFLDMDETLIHSQKQNQIGFYDYRFSVFVGSEKTDITFNLRPFCVEFLVGAAQHYDIVVYTAANFQYAQKIINFLNKMARNSIKALHSRQKCIKMSNGKVYKDPRIFKSLPHTDFIIIDDNLQCMHPVIDNGILVKAFTDDRHDRQLVTLLKIVNDAIMFDDLRYFLAKKL